MNVNTSDEVALNTLFGRALIHEDLRDALLKKGSRSHVLAVYELSREIYQFLLSLDDMPDLARLAACIYNHFSEQNGGNHDRAQLT